MAIIKSAARLIIEQHLASPFDGPLLTLGVPEIYASQDDIAQWYGESGRVPPSLAASEARTLLAKRLGWLTASTFFRSLGIREVVSIDIPGCEYPPDFEHDLNEPLPQDFLNRFNLLIDPGTLEHAFDVKTCLSNVAGAMKVGGIVIHFVPIYSYNGGYFSINPNVLHDFYRGNGFHILRAIIIMWDRYRPYTGKCRCYEYGEAWLGARHALADSDQCRFTPHLLLFARKDAQVPKIVCPIQNEHLASQTPTSDTANARLARRVRSLAYRLLPFEAAYALEARITRRQVLRQIREHSFWA